MPSPSSTTLKLAQKLIEVFPDRSKWGFEWYWALAGPLSAFSEQAVGAEEGVLAKTLLEALEEVLMRTARTSVHPDALAMVQRLSLPKFSSRRPLRR